jgi:hypothetical protein
MRRWIIVVLAAFAVNLLPLVGTVPYLRYLAYLASPGAVIIERWSVFDILGHMNAFLIWTAVLNTLIYSGAFWLILWFLRRMRKSN